MGSVTRWRYSRVSMASVVLACATSARAGEAGRGLLNDRFTAVLGTFVVGTNTKLRVDGSAGETGTEVNLERELGFKDANRFRVDATWRFLKRHKVRGLYFSTAREHSATLDRDITVGDSTYPVTAEVRSRFSFKVAELAYEYAFLQRANYEMMASLGLHAVRVKFELSGEATADGRSGQLSTETASTSLPLPVIGLRGLWEFHRHWYLDGQGQYFALKLDDMDGHLSDVRLGVARMFGDHWGIGAGWNRFKVSVDLAKERFRGELGWEYSGALVYLSGSL